MSGTKASGFASLSKERRTEIARQGGQASHAKMLAHQFDSDTARAAGRKGGLAKKRPRQLFFTKTAHTIENAWQRGVSDGAHDAANGSEPDCPFEDGTLAARWWQRGHEHTNAGGA